MRGQPYGKIINLALLIGTAIGILHPAFVDNKSLTQIVVSLFEPSLLSQGFVMRWLLVLAFSFSLYVYLIGRMYRNIPITVIFTKIEVTFLDDLGANAAIRRYQLLRANQPNVTAYYSKHITNTSNGTVPKNRINASVYADTTQINSTVHVYGRESSSLEVMHIFDRPLPFSGFMPLVPIWFLNKDYDRIPKFIRRNVVVRHAESVFLKGSVPFKHVT